MADCKIFRLERKGFRGIINYIDSLIKEHPTWGNRKIAIKTREQFIVDVSRESIRRYRLLKQKIEHTNIKQDNNNADTNSYYVCSRPLSKKKRGSWKDRVIHSALT
jgi:hypothetical protein